MEEFINLCLGGTNILYYFLKFRELCMYTPSLVSNPSDEMSHFLTGVSDDMVEECRSTILHDNMNISHLNGSYSISPRKHVKEKEYRGKDG